MLRFIVALSVVAAASAAARGELTTSELDDDVIGERQLVGKGSPSFPHYSPVYVPTTKKHKSPAYEAPVYIASGKKYKSPAYVAPIFDPPAGKKAPVMAPVYERPVWAPSYEAPTIKTPKPEPTSEPTKTPTTTPVNANTQSPVTVAPTPKTPTRYLPTGMSVAPTPRPTKSPSVDEEPTPAMTPTPNNPAPTIDGLTPTVPIAIPEPTSSEPTLTTAPVSSSTGSPITSVPTTSAPSSAPSNSPSVTPAVVFVNELGKTEGTGFVEVAYSTFLGSGIEMFSIYIYDINGMLVDSESLSEGVNSLNGLMFTFITYPNSTDTAEAFALVNDALQELLYFFSIGSVVNAINGPAKGNSSTDILSLAPLPPSVNDTETTSPEVEGKRATLFRASDNNETIKKQTDGNSAMGLTGIGCDFTDFMFGEVESTPGAVNTGQEVLGCQEPDAPPSFAPSFAPSFEIRGENGISTGAIVGIAVGGGLLVLIALIISCLFLKGGRYCGRRGTKGSRKKGAVPAEKIEDLETENIQQRFKILSKRSTPADDGLVDDAE